MKINLPIAAVVLVLSFANLQTMAVEPSGSAWPQFRGPQGTGESADKNVLTKWNAESVHWAADLPVSGHSSPVIWGDRIFLTGAIGAGANVERRTICLDRSNGSLLWSAVASKGEGETLHKMNSWATPSCATDGQVVLSFFGRGGLHCFDMDGKPLWSRNFGDFPGSWGVGASPIIVGDRVIQNCDSAGPSFLVALDKMSGKDIWKTERRVKPRGGWSTPVLVDAGNGPQLILNGEERVACYDVKTGQEQWSCSSFNGRGTPAPVWGHGLYYVVNGKSGDVYAVRPGGKGDVTSTHMAWHTERRGGRDLPSPVLAGKTLVVFNMSGIVAGYDAINGKELWKERVGGNFAGSPIVVGGLIYAASETGDVTVLDVSDGFKIVAKNSIGLSSDEIVRSSLGVADGKLYLRSDRRLYCIGK